MEAVTPSSLGFWAPGERERVSRAMATLHPRHHCLNDGTLNPPGLNPRVRLCERPTPAPSIFGKVGEAQDEAPSDSWAARQEVSSINRTGLAVSQ